MAREDSPFVADHAKEVLNYHLSLLIYFICCIPLIFVLVGIPLMIAILIVALICTIIGTVRAANGTLYRYPMTIRFF